MRKGFTLVELSIVLVIIGLLVSGILIGQSLINSAQLQGYVRKLQQYEIARTQFIGKFRSIPGDSRSFNPPGDASPGRTLSSGFGSIPGNGLLNGDEYNNIWTHLSQAGMTSEKFRPISTTSAGGPDDNCWECYIGEVAPMLAGSAIYAEQTGLKKIGLYANFTATGGAGVPHKPFFYSSLEVLDALSVDKKLDDGVSNTGNLMAKQVTDPDLPTQTLAESCDAWVQAGKSTKELCRFRWYPEGTNGTEFNDTGYNGFIY